MNKLYSAIVALLVTSPSLHAGTFLSFDFNGADPWSSATTDVMPSTPVPVEPSVEVKPVGSIDVVKTSDRSGALLFSVEVGDVGIPWSATLASGLLDVKNVETNLGKLTLSFDLAASIARPVTVRLESFSADKKRTGGLQKVIYPAAAEFLQRFAVDLSDMKPEGAGKFNPTDAFVQLSYVIEGPVWPGDSTHTVRIDNVALASPSFYVSPTGSDNNDGKTESNPLATPQKAADLAKPGDVILIMEGTYTRPPTNTEQNGLIHFDGAGTPAAWIVIKNYPGHKPTFFVDDSWDAIRIGGPIKNPAIPETPVAYLEVRGLHLRGNADKVMEQHAADVGQPKAATNGNAITITPRGRTLIPHHVRVADNIVEYFPGGGVSGLGGDYLQVENNVVQNNCWFMIYGGSGISFLEQQNFDEADNVYKCLIANNRLAWNRTYIPWAAVKKISDGNGIIIDTNNVPAKQHVYIGRTLIQNNLSVANGGSAIHAFKSRRVDIVNNTGYYSGASPELRWGQIWVNGVEDSNIVNNVMISRDDQPVNTVSKNSTDKNNPKVQRSNNVYFGGNTKPLMGTDDLVADPKLAKPSTDIPNSDFRLTAGSPAIGHGKWDKFVPLTDIDGNPRPLDRAPDAGAFQFNAKSAK